MNVSKAILDLFEKHGVKKDYSLITDLMGLVYDARIDEIKKMGIKKEVKSEG